MNKKLIFIIFALGLLIACSYERNHDPIGKDAAEQFYIEGGKKVLDMEYDSALLLLRKAYDKGLRKPMQIVTDSNFNDLIDHPEIRPEIRLLLEEYAVENYAKMNSINEIGKPIIVKGVILDELNNQPLRNVKIELVHADKDGFYFKENSMWNPRIFAYLISSEKGEFKINTIRPGRYKDDAGHIAPAHIHFTLKKEGFRIYGSEFTFEDDSIIMANGNTEGVPVAKQDFGTDSEYFVKIFMQRE